ncbi:MAG: hypothetical protein ACRENP_15680 [Longimicrobiales bacterium]
MPEVPTDGNSFHLSHDLTQGISMSGLRVLAIAALLVATTSPAFAQRGRGGGQAADSFPTNIPPDDARITAQKQQAIRMVDSMSTLTQQIVDQLFSFSELGTQEVETKKYLTGLVQRNGFRIERGVGGMPTAWVARWGTGRPWWQVWA